LSHQYRQRGTQNKSHALSDEDFLKEFTSNGTAILSEPETKVDWIVEGWLERAAIGLLFSAPKAGKSLNALQLAVSVASKIVKEWNGLPIIQHGPILYLLNDGSPRELKNRLRRNCRFLGVGPDLPDFHFFERIGTMDAFKTEIERSVKLIKPILVVLDSLYLSHNSGDENSAGDQQEFALELNRIVHEHNCGLLVIHHGTKASATSPLAMENARGSGVWLAIVADIMEFRKSLADTSRNYFKIWSREGQEHRVLAVRYCRTGECGEEKQGYAFIGETTEADERRRGDSKPSGTKVIASPNDVFGISEELSHGKAVQKIIATYNRGRTWAKDELKGWADAELVLTHEDGKNKLYRLNPNPPGSVPIPTEYEITPTTDDMGDFPN
jgi:hypothetical protein